MRLRVGLMVYVLVNASALSIQPLGGSRFSFAGRLLLWGLVFRVPAAFGRAAVRTGVWHHATLLLPSRLLCNRPDKGKWLLIAAAQLRTRRVTGEVGRPGGSSPVNVHVPDGFLRAGGAALGNNGSTVVTRSTVRGVKESTGGRHAATAAWSVRHDLRGCDRPRR